MNLLEEGRCDPGFDGSFHRSGARDVGKGLVTVRFGILRRNGQVVETK